MFSYLGAKTKIIKQYPAPRISPIVEPFCGSARYALQHWENDVYLFDINPYVTDAWKYLIRATQHEILSLPLLKDGETLDDYTLSSGERALIGFNLCRGKSKPRKRFYGWNGWTEAKRKQIADNLYKVKHFKIANVGYCNVDLNVEATWFIDPPYQEKQKTTTEPYLFKTIDYKHLTDWISTRKGDVIVCGGEGDDYLPFEFLTTTGSTSNLKQQEYIYTKYVESNSRIYSN